jgi:hypothetical protein
MRYDIIRKLFNTNTGYFIKPLTYWYKGNAEIGYALYRGYVYFGIAGHTLIDTYITKEEAIIEMKKLNAK